MTEFESIKLNKEFRFLYGRGINKISPSVVIYAAKNNKNIQRLGITCSKKIGNAVKRNRTKRVIRVAYRNLLEELNGFYDIVIVARTRCAYKKSDEVTCDLNNCFIQAGLIEDEKSN